MAQKQTMQKISQDPIQFVFINIGTIAREDDTQEDGELDDLNADADIPIEDLLRKFHPELFDANNTPTKNNGTSVSGNTSQPETASIQSEDEAMPSTSTGRGKR